MRTDFRLPRRVAALIILAAAAICLLISSTSASIFKKGKHIDISNLEQYDDDLYIYGNKLNLQGEVTGDLTAFCFSADITGGVGQSANIFCNSLFLKGRVSGSLRAFSQKVVVDGYVSRSVLGLGQDISLNQGSVVEKDVTLYCSSADLAGTIRGKADIHCERVVISGVITGDVAIDANEIEIVAPAVITGNLTYVSDQQARIETDKGVSVAGQTTWKKPEEKKEESTHENLTRFLLRISAALAAFIFGLIVVRIFRPYAEESFTQLKERFSIAIAAGVLGVIALVVCVIILLLALAFLVAGWILIASDLAPIGSIMLVFSTLMIPISSFLGITGGVILYSGKIVVAMWLGYLILSRARAEADPLSKGGMFLGLLILAILFFIPYLGTFLYIVVSIVGGGAILLGIKNCRRPIWGAAPGMPANPGLPPDGQGQA
jgi:cytoskeletal protein CcmA (bactofilin family)